MKNRTVYICISVFSFILMITLLNLFPSDNQDKTSYYYTDYETPAIQKKYFTYKQSDYIESFFIECSVVNNTVASLKNNDSQQPTFVYKNQNCWIYSLSSGSFLIKKENQYYEASRPQINKLAKELKNFSIETIENIK